MTDPLDRLVVCSICGWRGQLGTMKLSKHPGGIADCPTCGSPETYLADGARDGHFNNPRPKSEQH